MERSRLVGVRGNRIARGRSKSCGSQEDMWKRKRGTRGRGEEEVFRSSKKTVRSPDVEKGMGGGVEGMMRRLY